MSKFDVSYRAWIEKAEHDLLNIDKNLAAGRAMNAAARRVQARVLALFPASL